MNKKIILAGLVLMTGFTLLTAFGGKTKAQQEQEIAAEITRQLDEFRAQKKEECTLQVNEEAQRRYDEFVASQPTTKSGGTTTKRSTRPRTTTPTKVDPIPQTPPSTTVNPKESKMQGTPNTEEKKEKMQGTPNTEAKKKKMQGGGGGR